MVFVYWPRYLLHEFNFVFEYCAGGCCSGGDAGLGDFFDVLVDCRVPGEIARAVHGDRPGADNAAIFCKQCDLSSRADAVVVANRFAL